MGVEEAVRNYIVENLLHKGKVDSLSADDSLLDAGLLDSTGIFQVVSFLETEFDLEISDEEVVPDNFETIGSIVSLVKAKRSGET